MKLSIGIPVFNWDLAPLLGQLVKELPSLGEPVEILVGDDCSTRPDLKRQNERTVLGLGNPCVRHFSLPENRGLVHIRNFLGSQATGEYLLFLDSDVLPDAPDFLAAYLHSIKDGHWDVVCGGLSYETRILTGAEYDYRVYYGKRMEVAPAALRNGDPGLYLWASNTMLKRELFDQTPFDEAFVGYGYEDTDWGLRLIRNGKVHHIDNPVSHLGLNTKKEFYQKMRQSIRNYLLIRNRYPQVYLGSRAARLAERLKYLPIPSLCFTESCIRRLLSFGPVQKSLAVFLMQLCFTLLLAMKIRETGPLEMFDRHQVISE